MENRKSLANLIDCNLSIDRQGNWPCCRDYLYLYFDFLLEFGLAGSEIIKQIHAEIFNLDIPEILRIDLIKIVGEIDFRLNQGASELIQLNALLAKIVLLKP